jgi:hypothetical protein
VDLLSPRPDITFLRRRMRPGETQAAPAAPKIDYLNLSDDPAATPRSAAIPSKPQLSGRSALTLATPVVRMTPRQSAIGSLIVTGADIVSWGTTDGHHGTAKRGETLAGIKSFANRPLVAWVGDQLVVGLRHSADLRRVIIGSSTGALTATFAGGATFTADTRQGADVLYLAMIGTLLEARVETLNSDRNIETTFGIAS